MGDFLFNNKKLHTVESVTSGHPDKVCDQASDAILDACLTQDPKSRVAVESFGSHGLFVIGGEVTTKAVVLVHRLTRGLEQLRRQGRISWLLPDGKAQVTMQDGKIKTILVSCNHKKRVPLDEVRRGITNKLIKPLVGDLKGINILVNPTGRFEVGGFMADTGLTGRKIMVDTYGGLIPHGGGCFSGKDPTKVDRSGAYMCRYVAKNIVAKGLAKQCLVSVAYAIGRAEPLMVAAMDEKGRNLSGWVRHHFDFRPQAIIERLNLRTPIYLPTAAYGHFGRPEFPWEKVS